MVVGFLRAPDVPETVIADVPATAELPALNVSVLMLAVLAGLNRAVTPAGIPEADRATAPVNPPAGVTVIALLTLLPGLIVTADGEADIENAG
jgi:hypothetical protein